MRYDCRKEGRDPLAGSFPCPVRIVCAQTGERLPNVFFADTAPLGSPSLGRFLTGPDGEPLVSPVRKKRWVKNQHGRPAIEIYHDRLDVWERRPWRAISVATGEVVAQSEGSS